MTDRSLSQDRKAGSFSWWIALTLALVLPGVISHAETTGQLARIKDVATIEGIRDNQLIGYGLVVGLRGTVGGAGSGCTVAIWLGNMQKDDQMLYIEIGGI